MKKCPKCKAEIEDSATFCPSCGAQIKKDESASTAVTDEATQRKIMSVLAYLSWLVLIPIFVCKNDVVVRRHCNQGLGLAIIEIISWIVCGILGALAGAVAVMGWISLVLGWVVNIGACALSVLGIYRAIKEIDKPLPIVGKVHILK